MGKSIAFPGFEIVPVFFDELGIQHRHRIRIEVDGKHIIGLAVRTIPTGRMLPVGQREGETDLALGAPDLDGFVGAMLKETRRFEILAKVHQFLFAVPAPEQYKFPHHGFCGVFGHFSSPRRRISPIAYAVSAIRVFILLPARPVLKSNFIGN
jgi:hypothetical protein